MRWDLFKSFYIRKQILNNCINIECILFQYMRQRVRAIIKASRKAIIEEEGPLYDDT
jgi:predicted  nucleic acid-binding Zn-ribbon protein